VPIYYLEDNMKKLLGILFLSAFLMACDDGKPKPPFGVVLDRVNYAEKHVLKVQMEEDKAIKYCVVDEDNFGHYPTGKRASLYGEDCSYNSLTEIK
jgi:hypothetical protein